MELISLILNIIKLIISPLTKAITWVCEQLPFKVVRRKPLPKLGIIESSWRNHMWDYAKRGDEKIVIIHTHWQITNTLPYNLTAINVFLTKPERVKGMVLIKDTKSEYWGSYPILRGYTTEMDASFMIGKKYLKNTEDIINVNFEIQDAIGKIHKIDNIKINPIKKVLKKSDLLLVEDSSKLRSKVEKQVIAVLKNEIQQYKVRGRREGRLGTVEWPRGTLEWRNADDKIQFLFANSNKDNVTSEHINALLVLYNASSPKRKKEIVQSLLKRIDKKKEYRDIAYLIIFFLFEVDYLKDGLNAALERLKGDKANAFGDVLRILDFLLAFRFEEFNEDELNNIEAFVYSTKEHPFQIKERINAIRVKKMLGNDNSQIPKPKLIQTYATTKN